jgi:hypothetical protein
MKKYSLGAVCLYLTMIFPALAQESGAPDAPPSKAEVIQFMDLMEVKVRLAQILSPCLNRSLSIFLSLGTTRIPPIKIPWYRRPKAHR